MAYVPGHGPTQVLWMRRGAQIEECFEFGTGSCANQVAAAPGRRNCSGNSRIAIQSTAFKVLVLGIGVRTPQELEAVSTPPSQGIDSAYCSDPEKTFSPPLGTHSALAKHGLDLVLAVENGVHD